MILLRLISSHTPKGTSFCFLLPPPQIPKQIQGRLQQISETRDRCARRRCLCEYNTKGTRLDVAQGTSRRQGSSRTCSSLGMAWKGSICRYFETAGNCLSSSGGTARHKLVIFYVNLALRYKQALTASHNFKYHLTPLLATSLPYTPT